VRPRLTFRKVRRSSDGSGSEVCAANGLPMLPQPNSRDITSRESRRRGRLQRSRRAQGPSSAPRTTAVLGAWRPRQAPSQGSAAATNARSHSSRCCHKDSNTSYSPCQNAFRLVEIATRKWALPHIDTRRLAAPANINVECRWGVIRREWVEQNKKSGGASFRRFSASWRNTRSGDYAGLGAGGRGCPWSWEHQRKAWQAKP
jgi:hypothetical protein